MDNLIKFVVLALGVGVGIAIVGTAITMVIDKVTK